MRNQQQWLAVSLLTCMMSATAPALAEDADKCSARLVEIDAAIEEARKEGSMRKVATLKDLRAEALRCANKAKAD